MRCHAHHAGPARAGSAPRAPRRLINPKLALDLQSPQPLTYRSGLRALFGNLGSEVLSELACRSVLNQASEIGLGE